MQVPPSDDREYMESLPPCKHCGDSIFDHMQDGEPLYMCHPEHQMQATYGGFHGGDPRDFHPDYDSCTPEEIENHKRACAEAELVETKTDLQCPSGWERVVVNGQVAVAHVLRMPFGIGVTTYPPTCYEPREAVQ